MLTVLTIIIKVLVLLKAISAVIITLCTLKSNVICTKISDVITIIILITTSFKNDYV